MSNNNQAIAVTPLAIAEDLRVANLHVSNMLSLAQDKAQADEMDTIIHAARGYVNDEFAAYERLVEVARAEAEKGGA
jgi:hypothetical protein